MLKLNENPPTLLPSVKTLTEMNGTWWIAHTKSRFEKVFAWDLHRRGIGYFLPMIERIKISGGKKRRVMSPLFPSYVFFCGSDADRYAAMATDRLCQTLDVPDQSKLIIELDNIEKAMEGKAELDPYPFAAVGERCRIIAGPFSGLEGIVVSRDKMARLVLQVSILGQGAAIELDAGLLEPAD